MIHATCQIPALDEIYLKHFGDRKGSFVEIGAHDGVTFSNTWGLVNDEWIGLYVEPIKEYADKCRESYADNHRVSILECACSDYNGEIILYKGHDIYSANNEMVQGDAITVPCFTLDEIIRRNLGAKSDLIVIDVEFHEKEVLRGFTLDYWLPKMVIIEAHEAHENKAYRLNADFINQYFKSYEKIYSDEINNIYVR